MRKPLKNILRPLQNEKGFTLAMILAIVAVEGLIAVSILSWQESTRASLQKQKIKFGLDIAYEHIVDSLYQTSAWTFTANGDACLLTGTGCVPDVAIPLVVKNQANVIIVDSKVNNTGLNLKGVRCTGSEGTFNSVSGNDQCPFQYVISATPVNCVSGLCKIRITGQMAFKGASKKFNIPLNLNRYTLNYVHGYEQNSLQSSCLALGGNFDQNSLACTAPPVQTTPCPPYQVLKTVIQGKPPVCVTFFNNAFECPNGQAASGIRADGSLTCKVVL